MSKIKLSLCLLLIDALVFSSYSHADLRDSVTRMMKSCELKDSNACYGLGEMYKLGYQVVKDFDKSLNFYLKACDLNMGLACSKAGTIKLGIFGENEDAIKLYLKG